VTRGHWRKGESWQNEGHTYRLHLGRGKKKKGIDRCAFPPVGGKEGEGKKVSMKEYVHINDLNNTKEIGR